MCVDEGEDRGDETDLFGRWGLLAALAAAGSRPFFGIRLLVIPTFVYQALFTFSSLSAYALGDAIGIDVAARDFASAWTGGEFAVHGE